MHQILSRHCAPIVYTLVVLGVEFREQDDIFLVVRVGARDDGDKPC